MAGGGFSPRGPIVRITPDDLLRTLSRYDPEYKRLKAYVEQRPPWRIMGGAFPATGILDNFDRGDSASLGANWGAFYGDANLAILSNQASNSSGWRGNYWNVATYGPDCEAYFVVQGGATNRTNVFARVGGADLNSPDAYGVRVNNVAVPGDWNISREDSGTETDLGLTFSQSVSAGDSIGIFISGSTIYAEYKPSAGSWTSLANRSDGTYGAAGYLALESNSAAGAYDDFGGGTIAGGPAQGPTEYPPIVRPIIPKSSIMTTIRM